MRTKTKPQTRKYLILDKLSEIPRGDYTENINILLKKLDVHRSSFYRLINIESGSSSSMTTDQLLIFAEHFGCSVDELINKDEAI